MAGVVLDGFSIANFGRRKMSHQLSCRTQISQYLRDGEFSESDEFPLACLFSNETFIEEAVSEATYFENGETKNLPAWSNREVYPFPDPVGPQPIYNMSHEEVQTLPRFIGKGLKFVDFKLAVPDTMQKQLSFLDSIGMTRMDTVRVRGGEVTPLAVLSAVLPQPADLGGKIQGAGIILDRRTVFLRPANAEESHGAPGIGQQRTECGRGRGAACPRFKRSDHDGWHRSPV